MNNNTTPPEHTFLTPAEAIQRYRWGRTKGYQIMAAPDFPTAIKGRGSRRKRHRGVRGRSLHSDASVKHHRRLAAIMVAALLLGLSRYFAQCSRT